MSSQPLHKQIEHQEDGAGQQTPVEVAVPPIHDDVVTKHTEGARNDRNVSLSQRPSLYFVNPVKDSVGAESVGYEACPHQCRYSGVQTQYPTMPLRPSATQSIGLTEFEHDASSPFLMTISHYRRPHGREPVMPLDGQLPFNVSEQS